MADVAARTARQAHYTVFDCLTPSKLVVSVRLEKESRAEWWECRKQKLKKIKRDVTVEVINNNL